MEKIASTGLIACAFLFGVASCNQRTDNVEQAQETTEERFEDTAMEERKTDQAEFMTQAASSSMMEVEAGRLAQQRTQNPQVRQFAQMMVNDHSQANDRLRLLETSKNITLPDSMSNDHMDKLNELRDKTGADFDRAYMNRMADANDNDISLFEDAANNLEDPEIKAFASETLTKLREHHQRARQIRDALGNAGTTTGAP